MAEFDELDGVLRDVLQRAAQPGDSTGVADAIRSRVAAGDPGTSVATSAAPGWGGGAFSWMPWLGLVVLAGIGGTALGASGVLTPAENSVATPYHAIQATTPGFDCPGGAPVTRIAANERVLVLARSDDSDWVQVRDPRSLGDDVWLPVSVVTIDPDQAALASLPIGNCPEEGVIVAEPTPGPVPDDAPVPVPGPNPAPNPPPPPGDTTSPQISSAYGTPNPVYAFDPVQLYVTAADNVAVTGVTVTWSGQYSGSGQMTLISGTWRYTFAPPTNDDGTITFTFVARDAQGNSSAPSQINIDHYYFG